MAEQQPLLRRCDVARRYGVTVRTLERWAGQGIGPRPIRIGPRSIRYREADVLAWMAERVTRSEAVA